MEEIEEIMESEEDILNESLDRYAELVVEMASAHCMFCRSLIRIDVLPEEICITCFEAAFSIGGLSRKNDNFIKTPIFSEEQKKRLTERIAQRFESRYCLITLSVTDSHYIVEATGKDTLLTYPVLTKYAGLFN